MQLLLCSATELEIKPLLDFAPGQDNIDILITGIGLTAATYAITKRVIEKKPQFILQAGVAGCLDNSLALTQTVLIENETIGDLGVEENGNFQSVMDLSLQEKNQFPWKEGKLINNIDKLKATGFSWVNAVTVNEISTHPERIKYYRNQLGAQVETMEGAALHYVGLKQNIPFLQVRSLSNFIGERDKTKWVMDKAIANLNKELERIIHKFMKP